ncbi:hypothetical protein MMC29_004223 [Sticta canariensis]|nr:hypothetical protein [Sticta canariensis]
MFYSSLPVILTDLTALVLASPRLEKRTTFTGVATFNDFIKQGNTVCRHLTARNPNHFGAASGDISHDISPGRCDPPLDPDESKCNKAEGKPLDDHYVGPACPNTRTHCDKPTCFRVQNIGIFDSSSSNPTGTPIVVQIIDSCPAGHAQNYCKAFNADPSKIVPSKERCGDASTNYLDIDYNAYSKLTGAAFVEGQSANLNIQITEVDCITEQDK